MAEVLSGPSGLVEPAQRGQLVIDDRVIVTIAEVAARGVPAVVEVSSRYNPLSRSLPQAEAALTPSHARVTVRLATSWDRPLSDVAAEVRDTVAATITRLTATTVDIVNVDITSVVPQQPDTSTTPARTRRRNLQ